MAMVMAPVYPNHARLLGYNYQLQYRDSLTSGTLGECRRPDRGRHAPMQLVHPVGMSSTKRFYRLKVYP